MTEEEWLAATDPFPMLAFLRDKATDRKLRHLMAAFGTRVVGRFDDPASRRVVEILARFAEGAFDRRTLDARLTPLGKGCPAFESFGFPWCSHAAGRSLDGDVEEAVIWVLRRVLPPYPIVTDFDDFSAILAGAEGDTAVHNIAREASQTIRDVIGPLLFRPVLFDPGWRASTVLALANGIYADSAFDRLPILADALQDVGCDNDDILTHLRGGGTHWRGCWALDLVLGKG